MQEGPEPGTVQARVRSQKDVRAEAARAVVGAGLPLLAMDRATSGLEGIFVELSRGQHAPRAQSPAKEVTP